MKRRTFLSLCAITPTAGCADSAPGGSLFGSSGTRIKSLRATNYRSTAQTFHAKLSDGGETTYERTIEVPGLSDGIPGGKEFSEVPADSQTGQLTAYINDQSEQEWKHLSFDEIDADCVKVKLIISHVDNEFGIWYTVDCNDPSDPRQ
jgi:hypothetical protein